MGKFVLSLILVFVLIGFSYEQSFPERCLLSRLDYLPCLYQNKKIERASLNNQYSIHYTRLRVSSSGAVECNVRAKNQDIGQITDLGTDNMRVIYSPGFITMKEYDNQTLVQYNIQCREDQLAFFNVTDIEMQGPDDCHDNDDNPKCQDYILIDRGSFGTTEICGNSTSGDSVLELQSRNFTVYFRTSEEKTIKGFQMYIVCFNKEERNLEGCLTPSDFNRSVCRGGSTEDDMNEGTNSTDGRMKRDVYMDGLTYSDLFPGYPSGLRLRKDVAIFHSQWYRQRRQAAVDVRFIKRLIFFNESVNYKDNTINITDSDNIETDRYENVLVLQTFDAEGETMNYIHEVNIDRSPHFLGPGPMIILDRIAYFQMFVIDPRGLIPTAEEEDNLINMSRPLLEGIPASLDNTTFEEFQEREMFPFFQRRKRRDTTVPIQRKRRQDREDVIEFSESAVLAAMQNLEACNPVLRSQARSTLQYFNETFPETLQELLNFTINCELSGSQLNCSVDERFEPTLDLPEATYCTINNDPKTRQKCNPFYGQPAVLNTMEQTIWNVTVESLNCEGRRVKHTVTAGSGSGEEPLMQ